VLSNLGTFYGGKGAYEQSRVMLERALELRRRFLGETNLSTAITMNNLAMLNLKTENLGLAEDLFRNVLRVLTNAIPGGERSEPAMATLSNLGDAYREQARYQEAEPLLRRALELRRQRDGTNEVEAIREMNNFALFLQETGDYQGADELARRALELAETRYGPGATVTLDMRMNYAALLHRRGKSAEARELLRAVVTSREGKRGEESLELVADLLNLSVVAQELG
jgi:tetratricopeptide (TPR) repeat protein